MSVDALISGLIAAVISPFVVSWLQHQVIWRRQKTLELKHKIFEEAALALSMRSRDALDPRLQSESASYNGTRREVEIRPETIELLEKSRTMVHAFFTNETALSFDLALKAHIAIDNIPNEDFERQRTEAIITMATELGIRSRSPSEH